MAFKHSSQYLIFVLLLLLFQSPPSSQLGDPRPRGPGFPHYLPYKPNDNSTIHLVDMEKMKETIWDSGYKIMALLLKRELIDLVPYGVDEEDRFLKFFDGNMWKRYDINEDFGKELRLFDNNTVTVFAPPDEAFRLEQWMSFEYQIVLSKFDEEGIKQGLVSKGFKMATCDCHREYVEVTQADEVGGQLVASINNVDITKWNIYNDGHLIVHGVQDFFCPLWWISSGKKQTCSHFPGDWVCS